MLFCLGLIMLRFPSRIHSLTLRRPPSLSVFLKHLSENSSESEFGFCRTSFKQEPLVGTVQYYERHVFLCYKSPQVWPPHIDSPESGLPWLLSKALSARRNDLSSQTKFTICEGEDSTDSSDVLIFPDMRRYKQLTQLDIESFVENVLVNNKKGHLQPTEALTGSYIFVCSHGSRDKRCGHCGTSVIKKMKDEIKSRNLQHEVYVNACSHIGGHKYAGNVILFSPRDDGKVMGHWYGYVSPEDVPLLLDQHIVKGQIVPHLWRGQMGLTIEVQKRVHNHWLQQSDGRTEGNNWK